MLAGHDKLVDAWRILEQEVASRKALIQAATAFWSATYHLDQWSAALQEHAQQVQQTLLAHGKIPVTVTQMTEDEVSQARAQLRAFLQAALQSGDAQDG